MSTARKIFIVDDDEDLRESLKDQLGAARRIRGLTAGTATKGIEVVKSGTSISSCSTSGLPDMDGREACKLLRKIGFKSPIVMLTGNDSDADMILGLDSAPTTTSPSPSSSPCCWRASARSCASTSRARTRCSPSATTRSSRPRRC